MGLLDRIRQKTSLATLGIALLGSGCYTMREHAFYGPDYPQPVTLIEQPQNSSGNADDANLGAGILEVLAGAAGLRSPGAGLLLGPVAGIAGREAIIEGQKEAAQIGGQGSFKTDTNRDYMGYLEMRSKEFGLTWLVTSHDYADLDNSKSPTLNEFLDKKSRFSKSETITFSCSTERPMIKPTLVIFDNNGNKVTEMHEKTDDEGYLCSKAYKDFTPGRYQAVFTAQVPKHPLIFYGPGGKFGVVYILGTIPFEVVEGR